jgi:hypothetical protein
MARQRTVASRRARRPPAAGGDAAPVGRDDLLGRLRRAVDGAVTGRGVIVLLTGEAGIGKTTLLREAARYAEGTGARPAWGSGWPGGGAPGYWPWIQVLRALGLDHQLSREAGVTAAGDAPASARFQLFDEVTSLLLAESRIQPVVVLLDDLHAADEPSLLLLDFLVRRLPAGAISVIGTYRGPDPGPALGAVAARAVALPLAGLPAGAVAQLMADVLGQRPADAVAAAVHRRTGGNPFFVLQVSWLLKDGQAGIPPGVREALAERFAALSPACVAALGAAAVIGGRFRADLVAKTLEQPPEPVAEALAEGARAGVLTGDAPGSYRFVHDLFREFAYERLPVGERARLHLRTGRQLEADRARGADVPLAELAGHFVQAGPGSGQAYEYSAAAAREADGRLAYEEAARHWERALAAAGEDPGTRTGTLLALAQARWRMGAGQAAGETYLAAAGLARRDHDAVGLAHAALGLHEIGSRIWWPASQLVAVLSEAQDALAEVPGATPLRLRVMAGLARVLAWRGLDLPRARALAAEAVTRARAAGDVPVLAACLLAQHNALWAPGTAGERRAVAAEVAALAGQTGDRELLIEARLLAATDLLELADPAFRAELDEFAGLADATSQPRFRYATLARRAMLALLGGHFAEAERLIGQAAALGEECGEPGTRDVRHDQDWELRDGQGRLGELAGVPLDMFPDPDSPQARGLRALALLAAGDRAQAAQVAGPMFEGAPDRIPRNHQFLLGRRVRHRAGSRARPRPGRRVAVPGAAALRQPGGGVRCRDLLPWRGRASSGRAGGGAGPARRGRGPPGARGRRARAARRRAMGAAQPLRAGPAAAGRARAAGRGGRRAGRDRGRGGAARHGRARPRRPGPRRRGGPHPAGHRGVPARGRAVDADLRRGDGADTGRQGAGRPRGAARRARPRDPRRRSDGRGQRRARPGGPAAGGGRGAGRDGPAPDPPAAGRSG